MNLTVNEIYKSFGEKNVLKGISFSAESGKALGILGRNGAGKTTLIRIIMQVFGADTGTVLLDGEPIHTEKVHIGYLPEERGLYPKQKIMTQLLYFAELKGVDKKQAKVTADKYFNELEIEQYKNVRLDTLSKGNQQKIQLIAALAPNPELIILDEPLSGLDPVNAELFKGVIREEIKKNKYIIMSSHQMTTIEEFCRDIVIMNKGKTVLQGNLNAIKKGYGRVKLTVKAEGNISPLAAECGLVASEETPNGSSYNVQNEEQAHKLLHMIIDRKIPLIRYELREPTLNEIFIEKAGGGNED